MKLKQNFFFLLTCKARLVTFVTNKKKAKSDRKSHLTRNKSTNCANAAIFISVQTDQNLHESVSTLYKLHPHPQEYFLALHAKHVLARFGLRGKSLFSLQKYIALFLNQIFRKS